MKNNGNLNTNSNIELYNKEIERLYNEKKYLMSKIYEAKINYFCKVEANVRKGLNLNKGLISKKDYINDYNVVLNAYKQLVDLLSRYLLVCDYLDELKLKR